MSNHDGSYLLNEVLNLLYELKFFESIGHDKSYDFLQKIRTIGMQHDCNDGEILESLGNKLGLCYSCWEYNDNLDHGICIQCHSTFR